MMPTGETIAPVLPEDPTTDPWRRLRYGLLLLLLGIAAAALLTGTPPSSLGELKAAVAAGRVGEVRMQGALAPEEDGYARVVLLWNPGTGDRYVELVQASDESQVPMPSEVDTDLVIGSVAEPLLALDGSLAIVPDDGRLSGTVIAGWRVPAWVLAAALLAWGATLVLAMRGPEPWWGTRWAWFWAIFSLASMVTVPLFLLMSGPPPGVPAPAHAGRRLTGGRAFFLFVVMGPSLAATLT